MSGRRLEELCITGCTAGGGAARQGTGRARREGPASFAGGARQGNWRMEHEGHASSAGGARQGTGRARREGPASSAGGARQGNWRMEHEGPASSVGGGGGRHPPPIGGGGRSLAAVPHTKVRPQAGGGGKPTLATPTAQGQPRHRVHSLTKTVSLSSMLAQSGNNGPDKVSRSMPHVDVPSGDQPVKQVVPSAPRDAMKSPTPTTSAAEAVVDKAVEDDRTGRDLAMQLNHPPLGTGGELLFHILTRPGAEADYDCSWIAEEKYGPALRVVLGEHMTAGEQALGLFGAQRALATHGFPKGVTALLENVGVKLYQYDIVDEDGFIEWRDNDTHEKTTKNPALIQGAPFLIWLVEESDVSSDDE